VVVTLAAALSAVLVTGAMARSVLWRPLPFADPDRLYFAWERVTRDGVASPARVSFGRYLAWVGGGEAFDGLAAFNASALRLADVENARTIRGLRVSSNYFDVLGVTPLLGRTFTSFDAQAGAPPSIVLSHALWTELGARRDIVNARIRAGDVSYTVIGVMPPVVSPGFPLNPADVGIDPAQREFWVPLVRTPELDANTRAHVFGVVGRVARGRTAVEAEAALERTAPPGAAEPHGATLAPFRAQFVKDAGTQLAVLLAAALAIFLIAGANLAALLASAFELRRGEFAVRAALGAGVWRLAGQLGVESLVLSGAGGLTALAVTQALVSWLPSVLPPSVPLLTPPAMDATTVTVAIGLVAASTLMISLWPVSRLVWPTAASRSVATRARLPVYRGLVVVQVAATLTLVSAAALLGRSLDAVRNRDTGFAVEHTLIASLGIGADQSPEAVVTSTRDLMTAIAGAPGVRSVAVAYDHPLAANWSDGYILRGDVESPGRPPRQAELRIVSPSYFDTVRTEVVAGRAFLDDDGWGRPGVAMVNEAFARETGGTVVGRRLATGSPARNWPGAPAEFEIVGVVEDERFRGLEQPSRPAMYISTWQFPQAYVQLIARTDGEPLGAAGAVREAVRRATPVATIERLTSLDRILASQLAGRRITTGVVTAFGSLALALAAIGLYGLMAVSVADRRREFGVRVALGATPTSLAAGVLIHGLRWTAIGVAGGIALALVAGPLLASLLVGVTASDPVTLAISALVLFAVTAVATLVPALRAARVDPGTAVRSE
jgi:predicted permease